MPGFAGRVVMAILDADPIDSLKPGLEDPRAESGLAPDEDPEILKRALYDSERATFAQLRGQELPSVLDQYLN